MKPTAKNVLAVLAGLIGGGFVNMGIIMLSSAIIPPPEGADLTTMDGLKASMHLMEPKHFLMPFLAHAIGTFAGAWLAAKLSSTNHMKFALGIGAWFMLGGIINIFLLPSPTWFTIIDLAGAYLPMAYLAGRMALSTKQKA